MKNDNKIIEPKFYREFSCTADRCGDTCCKGWDIVVDDDTLEFYETVGGDILSHIVTDEDGDNILKFENGVCPFLDESKLCKIHAKYGGDKICGTCRVFPRITQDYTEFTEKMLTLACPEAARLMIVCRDKFDFIGDSEILRDDNGYDKDFMNFLLHTRFLTAEILRENAAFREKFTRAYSFVNYVQSLIDEDNFDSAALDNYCEECVQLPTLKRIVSLHRNMDVMDGEWLKEVMSLDSEIIPTSLDGELTSIALYYIAHYYLNAISNYDVITTMKRIWYACEVCGGLIVKGKAENDGEKRALIYQKYSKEIEHSDENYEIIESGEI